MCMSEDSSRTTTAALAPTGLAAVWQTTGRRNNASGRVTLSGSAVSSTKRAGAARREVSLGRCTVEGGNERVGCEQYPETSRAAAERCEGGGDDDDGRGRDGEVM